MAIAREMKLLKLSLMVVFFGWLVVWVMLPTKFFKKEWYPNLDKRLNSPHRFGSQGVNLVLLSFPIVLIAVGGCLFLYWQSKQQQEFSTRKKTRRSHVAVMPALGIVTSVEFLFFIMFIVLLVWSLGNYIYTSYTGHLHMDRPDLAIWKSKFRSVALRLGYIGNICVAFLFFPVARGSSILPLFGLTSESSIKYHIWLGHISMALFTAHTVGFLIYWGAMLHDMKNQIVEWSAEWVPNVAGEIAIVFALVIWVTSIKTIRRKMFEVFYYTHHLYAIYLLFYLLHVGAAFFSSILPGIFLFLIDRYLRFLQSRNSVKLLSSRRLPNGSYELNFAKTPGLVYNPTSTLFVNVGSVSKLQWHPFTVTSNSNLEPETLSVVVSNLGSWSSKLHQQLKSDHLRVSVEGPYGPSTCKFLSREKLVFASGGSGITPFISIFREIAFRSLKPGCHIPKVLLVCAFKRTTDLSMLNLLLPGGSTSTTIDVTNIHLQIEAYITRETGSKSEQAKITEEAIETFYYKNNSSDSPVAAVLGPNSLLWLGAIIATSFSLFLLLLALVFRFYISTKPTYHFSYYVLWNIFLLCASVFLVASIAFLLQKNRREGNMVNNMEGLTPAASPAIELRATSAEVESFPRDFITQATNVHYGGRPDLKEILRSQKESDVAVVACGPRKMMHDVARVCSSYEAWNLQFEAISFNW